MGKLTANHPLMICMLSDRFLSSTYLTDEHLVPKKLDLVYVVALQEMVCENIKAPGLVML